MEPVIKKDPGIAVVLSFFFTGLGQIYNGQIGKGLLFIVIQIINVLLMFVVIGFITGPLFWIYGMYDAYNVAKATHMIQPEQTPVSISTPETIQQSKL